MKILITGATGLVGHELGKELVRQGHELWVISRSEKKAKQKLSYPCGVIEGDLLKGPLVDQRLQTIEGVVHLMGESLAEGRWTAEKKKKIFDSRVLGTRHLIDSLAQSQNQSLKVFVSASAVGYYGDRGDEELDESSAPGSGFLASVCLAWESAAQTAVSVFPRARVVITRFGVILSEQGGAMPKMLPLFRMGLGAPLGSGTQWMSWVHLDDVVRALDFALRDERVEGACNVTAPNPVRNEEFSKKLARAFGKGLVFAVPKVVLKLVLGEMAAALLSSSKVRPTRLQQVGFQFRFTTVEDAFFRIASFFRLREQRASPQGFGPSDPAR